ncbi:MAG: hypothetical protein R2792_17885 [Saprospiraceae bacterium]
MPTNSRKFILDHLIALGAVLLVNYLSVALPLNGRTPGELSDQYPNFFVPAGLTFSIWGVIYGWLLVWVGFQIVAYFSASILTKLHNSLERIGYWFVVACGLNIAWLFAWHWELVGLSLLVMIGLFLVLMRINLRLYPAETAFERWLVHLPFGIYLGWISVALIANTTALLVSIGWSAWGIKEVSWAATLVSVGIVQAAYMILQRHNLGYGLAVSWALFGIYLKRIDLQEGKGLGVFALCGCIALLLIIVLRWKWLMRLGAAAGSGRSNH